MVKSGVQEDRRRRRGKMNCGNLGEECGRRDFPGDTRNIHCLTSIEFLKKSVQQSDQIMTEKSMVKQMVMVKQIQYLMYPCNCCNFLNKNLYCCFCFPVLQFYCAGRDEPWPSTSDIITFDQNWHTCILNFCRWKRSFQ